jgi:hypothetical protein
MEDSSQGDFTADVFQEATTYALVAVELTSRMLAIVAEDVRGWIADGIALQHASVNVGSADFFIGDLRQKIEDIFGRGGVPLDHPILEVKEDIYLGRLEMSFPAKSPGFAMAD